MSSQHQLFYYWITIYKHNQFDPLNSRTESMGFKPLGNDSIHTYNVITEPITPIYKLHNLYHPLKRIMDIVGSLILLFLVAPMMFAVAIAIHLDSDGPIIFRQKRVGARRKAEGRWERVSFIIFKFRTMIHNADDGLHREFVRSFIQNDDDTMTRLQDNTVDEQDRYKLANDTRITRVGAFLRKTSLDELPQLFNILKGNMSLVGPRPALDYEVQLYAPWQLRRLETLPGLTGLWQITGRSSVNFESMMALDIDYIENQSIWLDLKILFKTPHAVLFGKGAM